MVAARCASADFISIILQITIVIKFIVIGVRAPIDPGARIRYQCTRNKPHIPLNVPFGA